MEKAEITRIHSLEDVQEQKHEDLDEAYKFLELHREAGPVDQSAIRRATRKCDWHIVPLLMLNYFLQALDKQLLNVREDAAMYEDE